jgi:molybdopterin/thiamine biosynthesis adenylyltransferase
VGAGSLGSNLAVLLARMGLEDITVYDDDIVEAHNLGHQAYRNQDIGGYKVMALQHIIREQTRTIIISDCSRTDGADIDTDILLLATDTMSSRREISKNAEYNFCVDGRFGGLTGNIYTFSKMEWDKYEKTLYSDEEATPLSCGGRSIGFMSYIMAGLCEIQIRKLILAENPDFEINFCAENLLLETSKN